MTLPNEAYLLAASEHLNQCEEDLQELNEILRLRPLKRLEQHAAERTLQVLIEAAIGLAKHWAKKETGFSSSDAYSAFENLFNRGLIESTESWRKTIGLRNVLVHDYLNVDANIVRDVIAQRYYDEILAFGRKAIGDLEKV